MRNQRTRAGLALLLALAVCLGAGCAAPFPASAETVLTAMQEAVPGLPAGRCYLRTADPSSRVFLSGDLLSALLGPAARGLFEVSPDGSEAGTAVPAVRDAAVRLSESSAPGELAVLVCSDTDSALTAAALYRQRFDALSAAFPGTESAVRVRGCVVLAAFCRDAEAAVGAGAVR